MPVTINWLQEKLHTLHCHLQGAWTVDDLQALVQLYQTKTGQVNHPFDVILTADVAPNSLSNTTIEMPVSPCQQRLIVVHAHTFFAQLTDVLTFTPSASMTVFAGSWKEANHFADDEAA